MIVLGIWLLLTGLIALFSLGIPNQNIVMGVLALIAGILILLGI
jgi:hypothetical protein